MVLPVSEEGKIGVIARNPYSYRTRSYTFAEAIPAGIRKTGDVLASYWEQLKLIVQPKTKMYEELGDSSRSAASSPRSGTGRTSG